MILDCVLSSVNENTLYLDFVPIFIKTWNKLYPDVDVKIILIAKEIPEKLLPYNENIIIFEPIEGILTSFTSQFIRLLYPGILNYDNGVLITDIDMLPMNSNYYTKNIINIEDDKFIYYRGNVCFNNKEIAMCYNVANSKTWNEIFKVNSVDDIIRYIQIVNNINTIKAGHGNVGWNIDKLTLYKNVINWNKKTGNFICLNEDFTGFKRLDRGRFTLSDNNVVSDIVSGKYSDYHCLRPMSKYSKINWIIYDLLSK